MSAFASTSQQGDLSQILRGFTAGGVAAAVSKTTVAPIDRVKLLLQLQHRAQLKQHGGLVQAEYKGITDCFKKLCAEQGVMSLWRGNCASVARCFPTHALNFVLRDYYRMLFLNGVNKKTHYGRFVVGNILSGGVGAATALCFVYPLDLARTKLAVELKKDGSKKFTGIYDCLKSIAIKDGLSGVYRGFFCSLQFVVISRAVFFGMFDTLRGSVVEDPKTLSFFTMWFMAQTCVVTSAFLTYPIDTIRRNMMLDSGKSTKTFANSVDCFIKTTQQNGFRSLYKGALSNSLKSFSGALMVALYYEASKYM
ncbi:unnamed protein product [Bursaphelenchus xylophilus]|uniref:ADP/ATP translocase n=1 Tax=Bursaphelenchus xylophilus TaxID=6326 RepID=A0A1I7RZ69_BURXY|nr:unnamed protein product [Bursaphelenchus xylophilus]CAG9106793.1 unnamed protein product [Bursaphelenchus xylophilus]